MKQRWAPMIAATSGSTSDRERESRLERVSWTMTVLWDRPRGVRAPDSAPKPAPGTRISPLERPPGGVSV